jgi:hypothetical protein
MVVMSSYRVLLVCRWVECMRVTFVFLKPSHDNTIAMSDINRMC